MNVRLKCFQHVRGQVFDVDERMLNRLDQLESHPVLYERKPIEVEVQPCDGSPLRKEKIDTYLLTDFREDMKLLETLEEYKSEEHQLDAPPSLTNDSTPIMKFVKKK